MVQSIVLVVFRSQITWLLNILATRLQSGKFKLFGAEIEINHVTDTTQFQQLALQKPGEKPQIYGNPDMFELLAKATASNLMKSTKVMNTPTGCVVQVSTKEIGPTGSLSVAEAVTFVPGIKVKITKDQDNNVIETKFECIN
jgi:hypothetical protein